MKKNILISAILLLTVSLSFQSCKSSTKAKQDDGQTAMAGVIQIDSLLANAETLTGQDIEIEGVCTHICAHGGGKIFLMGTDDTKTIRAEAGEAIGSFKPETVNSIVRVKGKLVEDRIDEAYLTQWEEKVKAATAEKHGETEAGCSSEQKARGEAPADNTQQRIDNFRQRIAERKEKEGKDYLSFYHLDAASYEIQK